MERGKEQQKINYTFIETKDVEIMKMSNPKEFYSAQMHSSNSVDEPSTISIHLKAVQFTIHFYSLQSPTN